MLFNLCAGGTNKKENKFNGAPPGTRTLDPCILRSNILPCEEMVLPLDNKRNDIDKLFPERQIQSQLLAHGVCLVGQGLLISGGESGRRRGVFVLLRNVFGRDSILARTAELLATLWSFCGSTAPLQNLNRDFAPGPLHIAKQYPAFAWEYLTKQLKPTNYSRLSAR